MADPSWGQGALLIGPAVELFSSDSWAGAVSGGVGIATDVVDFVIDPIAALASSAVSMLLEHVEPLRTALEDLTGSPSEVQACAGVWTAAGSDVRARTADLSQSVISLQSSWQGEAADSYGEAIGGHIDTLYSLADGCDAAAGSFELAGVVVSIVRQIVFDLIADLVGKLISWGAEIAATVGVGASWVLPKAIHAIGKWIEIARGWCEKLTSAIRTFCQQVDSFDTALNTLLGQLRTRNIGHLIDLPTRVLRNGGISLGDLVPSLPAIAGGLLSGIEGQASS